MRVWSVCCKDGWLCTRLTRVSTPCVLCVDKTVRAEMKRQISFQKHSRTGCDHPICAAQYSCWWKQKQHQNRKVKQTTNKNSKSVPLFSLPKFLMWYFTRKCKSFSCFAVTLRHSCYHNVHVMVFALGVVACPHPAVRKESSLALPHLCAVTPQKPPNSPTHCDRILFWAMQFHFAE